MESWRKCSSCKNPIAFGSRYYECSVSTCNGQRTGYVFCSIPCFERHLPGARHKDAAAIEAFAPAAGVSAAVSAATPKRSIVRPPPPESREALVIASRLKEYIQARADFNTSASVIDVLSDHLRKLCDQAIEKARREGRKTVMDRDFSI